MLYSLTYMCFMFHNRRTQKYFLLGFLFVCLFVFMQFYLNRGKEIDNYWVLIESFICIISSNFINNNPVRELSPFLLERQRKQFRDIQEFAQGHKTSFHRPSACVLSCFSHVHLCETLWTVACQAPLPTNTTWKVQFSNRIHMSDSKYMFFLLHHTDYIHIQYNFMNRNLGFSNWESN